MTELLAALHALNLDGEVDLAGRWVKLQGTRCAVYLVAAAWGKCYFTWCDDPQARVVEAYSDPIEAVQAGLQRAAGSMDK